MFYFNRTSEDFSMPADLDRIVEIVATAPGWTRVGITAPDPRTRARATEAFAAFILDQLDNPAPVTTSAGQPL